MTTANPILAIAAKFQLDSPAVSAEPHGNGVINKTYRVTTESGNRYILQQLSTAAFKDIPALMKNIELITDYLSANSDGTPSMVIFPVKTTDGASYYQEGEDYYRVTPFAENTIALDAPETPDDLYQAARGFGGFVNSLRNFPADELIETIPNFHNTKDRYRIFHGALDANLSGRADQVQAEIDFLLAHEEEASTLHNLREAGELPARVTHNDTKLNNVLLDAETRTPKYVIDLDTVMPGLAAYDYGDSVRFGAATAAEDEPDTSKMDIDLDLYRVFTKGYLEACRGLTDREIELLPLGAKTITIELAMRFLTDYLNGDTYFAIKYPEHNLVRTHAQIALAKAMEAKWDEMQAILKEFRK